MNAKLNEAIRVVLLKLCSATHALWKVWEPLQKIKKDPPPVMFLYPTIKSHNNLLINNLFNEFWSEQHRQTNNHRNHTIWLLNQTLTFLCSLLQSHLVLNKPLKKVFYSFWRTLIGPIPSFFFCNDEWKNFSPL
jgi:hypothetical protein